jgi:hypothetical protein
MYLILIVSKCSKDIEDVGSIKEIDQAAMIDFSITQI